jgi:hypothetical protein
MNPDRHHGDHPEQPNVPPTMSGNQPEAGASERPVSAIRLTGPNQLLTAIPYLLRYNPPAGSLVLVAITGRQVVLTARLELPDPDEIPAPGELADRVWADTRPYLASGGADAVAVVAYADAPWTPELQRLAVSAPLPIVDLIRAHDGRWWSLTCPEPGGCGHPACGLGGAVWEPDEQVVIPFIAAGAAAPGGRDQLATCLAPAADDVRDDVAQHLAGIPKRDREQLYQAVAEAHDARTGGPDLIPPLQAAILLRAVGDLVVRDQVLAWTDDAAWWLWLDLIPLAPPGQVAPVATLIAVVAYQRGDTVMAEIATRHALADDPGYRLAQLIRDSLRAAIHPDAIRALITDAMATYALLDLRGQSGDPTVDGSR